MNVQVFWLHAGDEQLSDNKMRDIQERKRLPSRDV